MGWRFSNNLTEFLSVLNYYVMIKHNTVVKGGYALQVRFHFEQKKGCFDEEYIYHFVQRGLPRLRFTMPTQKKLKLVVDFVMMDSFIRL